MRPRFPTIVCALWFLTVALLPGTCALAVQIDGFSEPYRDIDVAASEIGIISSIEVKEGDRVTQGQLLARLDETLLQAALDIAKSAMESRGRLESASEELKLQTDMLAKLRDLRTRSHASLQEVERAETQLRIAAARLKAVREDHELKSLEYQRAQLELQRRRLVSPIDGVVTRILKDEGEFVSPADPVILKVVELDPLLVIFLVPAELVRELEVKQTVDVRMPAKATTVQGEVEFVSPTPDPQSGTARVRVRIDNPGEKLPSGATCQLILPDAARLSIGTAIPAGE